MSTERYTIDDDLYERVINCLADHEGQPAVKIALCAGVEAARAKRVLREAERIGQATRRGTNWFLG